MAKRDERVDRAKAENEAENTNVVAAQDVRDVRDADKAEETAREAHEVEERVAASDEKLSDAHKEAEKAVEKSHKNVNKGGVSYHL